MGFMPPELVFRGDEPCGSEHFRRSILPPGLKPCGIHAIVGVTGTDQPDRVSPIRIKEITMIDAIFGLSSDVLDGAGGVAGDIIWWINDLLTKVIEVF